jgi:prepilin-type N-terminal cleavage/methylation domain-containing protein
MTRATPGSARAQGGFTLLEAIVALTIFAICAMALYGWLAVNVNALLRTGARSDALRDDRVALAVLEPVNPMTEPKGERILPGGLSVRWSGKEIDRRSSVSAAGTPLAFDLALYDLDVEVRRGNRRVDRFTVRRAGWVTARTLKNVEP